MRNKLGIVLSVVGLVVLSVGLNFSQVHAESRIPSYETADCQFTVSAETQVDCGYLTVLEDRSRPDGATIRLHVAIFRAPDKDRVPDPIIFLDGGPGAPTLITASAAYKAEFARFGAKHDFIMFDQRGVGFSRPLLDCPELTNLDYENIGKALTIQEQNDSKTKAVEACRERLISEGINLSVYTTAASAADVNDLRLALGYKEWNLYGISYGTRLALTIMRDYPKGLRSAILDSTVPLQVHLFSDLPANANRAFKIFFNGCAQDAQCSKAYPRLENVFYKVVDTLNSSPVTVSIKHPISGKTYDIIVNGKMLVSTLFQLLYSSSTIPQLPKFIFNMRDGDYSFLARLELNGIVGADSFSQGMYYSVQCAEEIGFETQRSLTNADKKFPEQQHGLAVDSYYNVCNLWKVNPAPPIESKPVVSDLPTLILSGEYDPITPPSYGKEASRTLRHSFYFVFPGLGHGVSVSDVCPRRIVSDFLKTPTNRPNSTCIARMVGPDYVSN